MKYYVGTDNWHGHGKVDYVKRARNCSSPLQAMRVIAEAMAEEHVVYDGDELFVSIWDGDSRVCSATYNVAVTITLTEVEDES